MKNILFMLVALLTISASTMSVSAQVSNSFATVAAGDYAGTYNGELTYTITVNSEYSGALFTAIVTFKGNK